MLRDDGITVTNWEDIRFTNIMGGGTIRNIEAYLGTDAETRRRGDRAKQDLREPRLLKTSNG